MTMEIIDKKTPSMLEFMLVPGSIIKMAREFARVAPEELRDEKIIVYGAIGAMELTRLGIYGIIINSLYQTLVR